MSRLVATSLLLLAVFGFGSCQDDYKYNDSCIAIELKMKASITYLMTNGTNRTIDVLARNYTREYTECFQNETGFIDIEFLQYVDLTMDFSANGTDTWSLDSLELHYTNAEELGFVDPRFPEETLYGSTNAIRNVGWGTSYRCSRNLMVDLTGEDGNGAATITFENIHLQVFNFTSNGVFTSGVQCSTGSKSDDKIVPIAVGCALAGLVVIVLIAYLIGRFRSRNTDSYQVLS